MIAKTGGTSTIPSEIGRVVRGYALALGEVGITSLCLLFLRDRVELGKAQVGLVYILVVASCAAAAGTRPAIVAAVFSFLTWDYFFLEPLYDFSIRDPRDWFLLVVFLIIAVLVGQMTGRVRDREEEALARERDTAALYASSLAIVSATTVREALPDLLRHIRDRLPCDGCAVLDLRDGHINVIASLGDMAFLDEPDALILVKYVSEQIKAVGLGSPPSLSPLFIDRWRGPRAIVEDVSWPVSVTDASVVGHSTHRADVVLPLAKVDRSFGVLFIMRNSTQPFTFTEQRLCVAFASHAAACLERQRLVDEARGAATQQETERLKSVLFSSLSHNLKTPLASLNTTVSSLLADDVEWDSTSLHESLEMIDEDLTLLNHQIEDLLSLAQLEAGNWQPQREWVETDEVIGMALRLLPQREQARVKVNDAYNPFVFVDAVQMSQVVRHLLENALAYSPPGSPVQIGVQEVPAVAGRVLKTAILYVDDAGPGIDSVEAERIFRKFYRGDAARRGAVRGTGLGLSICQEIVAAHDGRIEISRSAAGGTRVSVQLTVKSTSLDAR